MHDCFPMLLFLSLSLLEYGAFLACSISLLVCALYCSLLFLRFNAGALPSSSSIVQNSCYKMFQRFSLFTLVDFVLWVISHKSFFFLVFILHCFFFLYYSFSKKKRKLSVNGIHKYFRCKIRVI